MTTDDVIEEVRVERMRQQDEENFTPFTDDEWWNGEIAAAASVYADPNPSLQPYGSTFVPERWPWSPPTYKPHDRRRQLIIAAALLVAEIERYDRVLHSSSG